MGELLLRHLADVGARIGEHLVEHLDLGAQPPQLARRLGDGQDLGIILGELDERLGREIGRRHRLLQLLLARLDGGDPFGREAGHRRASAFASSAKGTSRCSPLGEVLHRRLAARQLVVAEDDRVARAAGGGLLHPPLHIAAKGHVADQAGAAQLGDQAQRLGLGRLAHRHQSGVDAGRRGRIEQHRQPLDAAGPADRRRGGPAHLLDHARDGGDRRGSGADGRGGQGRGATLIADAARAPASSATWLPRQSSAGCRKPARAARYAIILGDDELAPRRGGGQGSRQRRAADVPSPVSRGRRAITRFSAERVAAIEARKEELQRRCRRPTSRPSASTLSKDYAEILPVAEAARELRRLRAEIEVLDEMLADPSPEIREMAQEELAHSRPAARGRARPRVKLLPRDAADERAAMLEIRAGTGGDEAALFAGDLLRMYQRYAESQGWRFEMISASAVRGRRLQGSDRLGRGRGVFARLKFESGVHRVQRVPVTESGGRIHTSAATVAVLPEAEEVDVQIDDKDLRIDIYRSSGPGGQRSTPPTARCASPIFPPASSSSSRTRSRSTRTRPRR